MTKIEIIWEELETNTSLQSGLLYKRYSSAVIPDLYVAVKVPEKLRCIALHLSSFQNIDLHKWDNFRDIKIESMSDEKDPDKKYLLILLLNNQHKEIFSILSEDLIAYVAKITEENNLLKQLLLRLEEWHLMFEKLSQQGLSEEAQRGLYGELFFLRLFLKHVTDYEKCINSWKGPEKSEQDFQDNEWAVEVKTTHGKSPQKIQISSERQLDTTFIPNIFLFHTSLDIKENIGESLNDIVNDLFEILNVDPLALGSFSAKLLKAGYFKIHENYYKSNGYHIRNIFIYRVTDSFPRIIERDINPGIGDVRYSIVISANSEWEITEDQLFNELTFN